MLRDCHLIFIVIVSHHHSPVSSDYRYLLTVRCERACTESSPLHQPQSSIPVFLRCPPHPTSCRVTRGPGPPTLHRTRTYRRRD